MSIAHDVIVLADCRQPGSASATLTAELRALARAGYRIGLLPVSPSLDAARPGIAPPLRALLDEGAVALLDPEQPTSCGLLLVHAPQAFVHPSPTPLLIDAANPWVILRDTSSTADDRALPAVHRNLEQALGREPTWVAGSPVQGRRLEAAGLADRRLDDLWQPVVDATLFAVDRPRDQEFALGSAAGGPTVVWPRGRTELLEIFPARPDLLVRLWAPPGLIERLAAPLPPNWRVRAFEPEARASALAALSVFARFGALDRVDDRLPVLIEALAAGCVLLLPPARREQLGDAALYAAPGEAAACALELRDDAQALAAQSAHGLAVARERFGPARHVEWLRPVLGQPAGVVVRPLRPRRRQVLFIASNGVGMGHLTRTLAIAKRCPPSLQPVFFTFSQGIAAVEAEGFPVHFAPDARALGVEQGAWNRHVEAELREICALWDPAVLVFDGNNPYAPVVRTLESRRAMASVWVRRAFWRAGRGAVSVERETAFDVVLEPADFAEADDRGVTRHHRERTHRIAPVRLVADDETLPQSRARDEFGLPQGGECILLAFGAGNNFDFATALGVCVDTFAARGAEVLYADSPIARDPLPLPPQVRRLRRFPLARHLAAFDMAVSAAGYNSFHELLLAGLPTLFVPNAEMTMDDQEARARFAARCGLALAADARNPYALRSALKRLCDPSLRQALQGRMQRLDRTNGALEAARIIEELAWTARYDRGVAKEPSG